MFANELRDERRTVMSDNGICELELKGKITFDSFCAINLDRIPKYPPEETYVVAALDRMRALEIHMLEVRELAIENRDKISSTQL